MMEQLISVKTQQAIKMLMMLDIINRFTLKISAKRRKYLNRVYRLRGI